MIRSASGESLAPNSANGAEAEGAAEHARVELHRLAGVAVEVQGACPPRRAAAEY
jgi:hypothetical protein